MPPSPYAADPAFGALALLPILYLSILAFKGLRYQGGVSRILLQDIPNNETLESINHVLMAINEASKLVFTAEKRANVFVDGQYLSLAYGRVGAMGPAACGPSWRMKKALFAIASAEKLEWMKKRQDLFRPAFIGSPYSVFFVNLANLEAALACLIP